MPKSHVLILCLLMGAGLPAQPVAAQDQQADDAHPAACLHEAFEAFAFLAGDWTVASRYRNADGDWEETTADAAITYDMDGCLLVERLRGTRQDAPFSARAFMTYDPIANRLQRAWTDSAHGLLVLYEGTATAEGVTLQNEMAIGDRTVLFQHIYRDLGDDTFRFESRRSVDGGQTWDTGWYQTYRRVE